jgi:hypothetical protein
MFEIHPTNWPFAEDTTAPTNQFHETALHEARIATDARGIVPQTETSPSFVSRLRLAFAGGRAVTEPCNCPA